MAARFLPDWLLNSTLALAALSLFGLLLRQVGPWRKQISETEERLRTELRAELQTERQARQAADARLEKMERKLERQQLRHNAERALDRHRLNNIQQCFDSLLLLVEMNPDKANEVVTRIKEMRAAQIVAEAEEKAIIRAAEIQADELETDHDGN